MNAVIGVQVCRGVEVVQKLPVHIVSNYLNNLFLRVSPGPEFKGIVWALLE